MSLWGMNEHGEPVTPRDHALGLIEKAIAAHIDTRLAIAAATGLDEKAVDQIRHLHLAEPWLPAHDAMKLIEKAGLKVVEVAK